MALRDAWLYFVPKSVVQTRIDNLSRDGYHSSWLVERQQRRVQRLEAIRDFWPWRRGQGQHAEVDDFGE